jgi:hypothetical protein
MKKIINKRRFAEAFLVIAIIGILLVIPVISALGVSSDYSSESPLTIAPGEIRTVEILRLKSGTADENKGNLEIKAELIDGAGIASLVGGDKYSITPISDGKVNVKITIPETAAEGTKYSVVFKFTDVTSSNNEGMVSFSKSTTVTMPILVQKTIVSEEQTALEKPDNGSMSWVIIVIALIVIIAIVAYLFLSKKKAPGKSK